MKTKYLFLIVAVFYCNLCVAQSHATRVQNASQSQGAQTSNCSYNPAQNTGNSHGNASAQYHQSTPCQPSRSSVQSPGNSSVVSHSQHTGISRSDIQKASGTSHVISGSKTPAINASPGTSVPSHKISLKENIPTLEINEGGLVWVPLSGPATTNQNVQNQVAPVKTEKNLCTVDSTIPLNGQSKPVIFYKRNFREVKLDALGFYGIQLGYYKDLASCRKDLKKYKSFFNVAGFICEDWNVYNPSDKNERPYRLILGHFPHAIVAKKLFDRVRMYFPFCFIVKYA